MDIRKAAEDARDAGMIRAHVRIPDLLAVMDERDELTGAIATLFILAKASPIKNTVIEDVGRERARDAMRLGQKCRDALDTR
jgi:hypothetical protein